MSEPKKLTATAVYRCMTETQTKVTIPEVAGEKPEETYKRFRKAAEALSTYMRGGRCKTMFSSLLTDTLPPKVASYIKNVQGKKAAGKATSTGPVEVAKNYELLKGEALYWCETMIDLRDYFTLIIPITIPRLRDEKPEDMLRRFEKAAENVGGCYEKKFIRFVSLPHAVKEAWEAKKNAGVPTKSTIFTPSAPKISKRGRGCSY